MWLFRMYNISTFFWEGQYVCEINRSRYSAYLLHVHVVFMTKYRRPVFGELHHANMRQYVAEVCADFGAGLKECDGEADHVHMLIEYPPLVQLTKLVNSLKSVTSRRLRNDFIDLRAAYSKPVLWSRSYFIGSCGGAPLEVVKKYIQNQRG
ncbi:TPA: IS200/IS605-like element ISEc41 family transposase [Escherichia coli]|nr:IS200/IS605-like element ISEc41 family transposase [Escherichia coli]